MTNDERIKEIMFQMGINNQFQYGCIIKLTKQQIRQRESLNRVLSKELKYLQKSKDN